MIKFPTLDEAVEIHRRLIDRFGSAHGVRDLGLLESALHRPQTGYYHDLPEMAAALMESLLMNHCCIDGNKRLAFFLTDVFLRMNGYRIEVEATAGEKFIVDFIARPERNTQELRQWLMEHLQKA